ncbi:MAG: hypothetical protein ACRDGD_03740 [Candidatus Limnocylindria bacterium]
MATDRHPTAAIDRLTFLIGGIAAIVGSLLGMVGNLIHPATPIGDAHGVAHTITGSADWTPIHVAIVFGIILMLGGLVALAHAVRGALAQALTRFALPAAAAGIAVGLVLVIVDGVAARQLAEEWAAATGEEQAIMLRIVSANETTNFALASLFNILFAGMTFILFGLAVATSTNFPRWFGWVVVLGGIESIVAGVIQADAGAPMEATRLLTIIGPTIITLWLAVMGVLLVREAGRFGSADATNAGAVPAESAS